MERFDVAIVGTGPAGSTAAQRLAEAGARVVVLDKAVLPRYKTCGGGVVGRARRLFGTPVDRAVEHECRRAEVHLADAALRQVVERAEPLVSMTMRSALDALLASGAAAAGATLRSASRVRAIEPAHGGAVVRTERGALAATFVIAADGATGVTARTAGWPPHRHAVPALEWEVTVPESVHARFAGTARFDFGGVPHGYAWVFPKRNHLSVGVLATRRGPAALERWLEDYLRRVGVVGIERVERHGYVIPLRPLPGPLVRNRTIVVGDAAGFADPLTAEGISGAALSGALAARAVVASGGDESRARRVYARAVARDILPDLRAARRYARVLYDWPRLRAWVFRRRGRALAEATAEVMTGNRSYREALGALRLLLPAVP
ncbi:MAG TPA: geranylgeranyl reductase family protein [Gemmatimonadales bacterium]|nr:geranylgeranyl reductase family protein [Gemmatimonadales bacterium]